MIVSERQFAAERGENGDPMNLKFDMGADTLTQLTKQTSTSNDDLGALVRQLAQAAEPLQGRFHGSARAAFDQFHAESGRISADLNRALASVLGGIASQNTAFIEGEQTMVDETKSAMSSTNFDAARFGGR